MILFFTAKVPLGISISQNNFEKWKFCRNSNWMFSFNKVELLNDDKIANLYFTQNSKYEKNTFNT